METITPMMLRKWFFTVVVFSLSAVSLTAVGAQEGGTVAPIF